MKYSSWEQLGDELKSSIWEAVETGNFSSLSQTVSNTINQAIDSISGNSGSYTHSGSAGQGASGNQYTYGNPGSSGQGASGSQYTYGNSGSANQGASGSRYTYGNSGSAGQGASGSRYAYGNPGSASAGTSSRHGRPSKKIFASGTGAKVGGSLMAWLGGGVALIYLLGLVSMLFDAWFYSAGEIFSCALFAAAFGAVSVSGFRRLGLLKRYHKYVCLLEGHEYYDVQKLADQSCRPVEAVRKDLKRIIIKGWFRQGYLDKNGTCLMLTEQAHEQYLALMDQTHRQQAEAAEQERLRKRQEEREAEERARKEAAQAKTEEERRKKEEELRRKEEERYANLPEEVRDIIRTGNDYIEKVHKLNDEIPGEEVTAKISRMELLLDRIFDHVEHHPESASDVRRLMDYYLPMTVKLLEAYRDMDRQPVQLSNIVSSKQEIEKTLDTLNSAFEKLLDDLFTATAWDLSSDISVLNTLLAQDGLTGKDIKKEQSAK